MSVSLPELWAVLALYRTIPDFCHINFLSVIIWISSANIVHQLYVSLTVLHNAYRAYPVAPFDTLIISSHLASHLA